MLSIPTAVIMFSRSLKKILQVFSGDRTNSIGDCSERPGGQMLQSWMPMPSKNI